MSVVDLKHSHLKMGEADVIAAFRRNMNDHIRNPICTLLRRGNQARIGFICVLDIGICTVILTKRALLVFDSGRSGEMIIME